MGLAMLLALPLMMFAGSLLDIATNDDHAADASEDETSFANGDLLDADPPIL